MARAKRILLVDDDSLLCDTLKEQFAVHQEFALDCLGDAHSAIERAKQLFGALWAKFAAAAPQTVLWFAVRPSPVVCRSMATPKKFSFSGMSRMLFV